MNDVDPVIQEFDEVGRRLWEEGGGTVDGFFDLCHRTALQARKEYALYGDRWRGVGREPAKPDETEGKTHAEAQEAQREGGTEGVWSLVDGKSMMVCEGEAPRYGETGGSARKGGEGEA